jgi:hypothetical protein
MIDPAKLPPPPPMRHVVKGWWVHREFDTDIEADNYMRGFLVKLVQLCAVLVAVATATCLIALSRLWV